MSGHSIKQLQAELERRRLSAELARRRLDGFISHTYPGYTHSNFSRQICAALDEFMLAVQARKRPILVLQAPPQHGKSEIVSRRLPPYIFGRWPNTRIASCSYALDLAHDMNRDVQRIMMSPEYREVFPETALNEKRVVTVEGQALRNSDRFDIIGRKGYYVCAGIGGPLTGKSVDIGIIDDPIKNAEEARSAAIKKKIREWYDQVFLTRLSKTSGQIIMATAWAVDDLAATVLARGNAKHLKFKAIQDDGTALVPELHPIEKLLETKEALHPAAWAAMYDSSPVIEGGNIFMSGWIKTYTPAQLPGRFDEVIQSWDMTFKDTSGSDFVVGQVWGRKNASFYLLDQHRARLSFTDTIPCVLDFRARYPEASAVLIEDKANGPAVISTIKNHVPGVLPVQPDGSKVSRAFAVTPFWQAGNVYLPANAPWRSDFDLELVSFPNAANDDQIDAMTQALRYLAPHGSWSWSQFG